MMTWDPKEDGVTHINIYSKGFTPLGRALSNFADIGFTHPKHGPFASVEGYWYWLSTNDDKLRTLTGYKAKEYGRSIRGEDWPQSKDFEDNIKIALVNKIFQNQWLLDDFRASTLPLVHYYVYKEKVVEPKEGLWMIAFLMDVREEIKTPGSVNNPG